MSLLSTPDNSCSLIALSARHSDQAHRNAPRLLDLLQRDETREPLDPDLRGKHVVHDFAVVIDIARERALVTAAVRRLLRTDDSVEAIAAEIGYSDARSLRRFLKAATGTTPQQIRAEGVSSDPDDGAVRSRLQAIGAMMGA